MTARRLVRLAIIPSLILAMLGLPGSAAGATALVALDLHVSPTHALEGTAVTFYGSVTRVSGTPTDVRVALDLPASYTTGDCEPACVDGTRFEWAFPTVTGRTTFTLTAPYTGLGDFARLSLAGGNAGCSEGCPTDAMLPSDPMVWSTVTYEGGGPVVNGSTIHVQVRANVAVPILHGPAPVGGFPPVAGVLAVELASGVGIPTNITGGAAYHADPWPGIELPVALAPASQFEFDIPITAPNGGGAYLAASFTPALMNTVYVDDNDVYVRVGPDAARPTATGPRPRLALGMRAGGAPVYVAWSGADKGSGIERYVLAQQTDGGAWKRLPGSYLLPRTTRRLPAGHEYRFRVRAIDHAGNVGTWAYGPAFSVSKLQESSRAITYRNSWVLRSSPRYWGGHARSGGTDSVARFTTTSRSVSWVAVRSPTGGVARIWVDGIVYEKIDLWAPTLQAPEVVWTARWAHQATRTVRIKVTEHYGGHRVDIDGFYVIP